MEGDKRGMHDAEPDRLIDAHGGERTGKGAKRSSGVRYMRVSDTVLRSAGRGEGAGEAYRRKWGARDGVGHPETGSGASTRGEMLRRVTPGLCSLPRQLILK